MPTENEVEFDKIIKRSAQNINKLLQDLHYKDISETHAYFYTNNMYLLTRIEMDLNEADGKRVINEKTLKEEHKYLVKLLDDIDEILKTKQNSSRIDDTLPLEKINLKKVYQGLETEKPREDIGQKLMDMENLQATTNKLFSDKGNESNKYGFFERIKIFFSDLIRMVKEFFGKDSKEEIHKVKPMSEEIQDLKKQDASIINKEEISTDPKEKIDEEITRKRKSMFSRTSKSIKNSSSEAPSHGNDSSKKLKKG